MKPTQKWLVAAFFDPHDNNLDAWKESQEKSMQKDVERFAELTKIKHEVGIEFSWMSAHVLHGSNWRSFDDMMNRDILPGVQSYFVENDFHGLAWLLNRDLLEKCDVGSFFVPFVRSRFFSLRQHPEHLICCFGGTLMRCNAQSANVCDRATCNLCSSDDILENCRHTCYWYLLSLMMGSRRDMESMSNPPYTTICQPLRTRYIFT